jgi:hypothetical protein
MEQLHCMGDVCCGRMAEDLDRRCERHEQRADCPDALIGRMRGGYGIMVHDVR